jgi:replicative DNA helicase
MASTGRDDAGHPARSLNSEILDRLPPQNLDAEKGVLGSMLLNPVVCDDVALVIRPDDFYAEANRKLYAHMMAMHDEGGRIDTVLLVERLRQAGDLEAVGGTAYLAEVVQSVAVAAHAEYYARIVRDKATLRALIHASTQILRDAYDTTVEPREVVSAAEEKIFAVHDQRSSDQVTEMHDVLIEAFEQIDHRLEHGGATGVPTGFTDLDTMTGGLHDSELIILAARPSMGKTALATNVADYVTVESNVAALFVSLEMSRLELAQRMLCSRGKIDGRKFRGGYLSSEDRDKLVEASARLSKAPLFIDDSPARTVTEIAASARRLKRKANLGLVVIDYLQLIEPDNPRDPRQEQVARIARRLKGIAREMKLPVICLAQLNRQAEAGKEGHRPRLSHLRESGAIEQDADVVMFVHREEYYHTREEAQERDLVGKADLIIAKQRNGPVGDVKLTWLEQHTRFENLAHKPYDEFEDFNTQEVESSW